jgi:hypothetical protein
MCLITFDPIAQEAFSTFVGWRFVLYACSDDNMSHSWELFTQHPAFLSCLVLVRWTQVGATRTAMLN